MFLFKLIKTINSINNVTKYICLNYFDLFYSQKMK